MRDYGNMPTLKLQDQGSVHRAKAQILHEEPLILELPEGVDLSVEPETCGGHLDPATGIHYNCDGGKTLSRLARQAHLPDLEQLAIAAAETRAEVDVDAGGHRLIIHD